MAAAKRPKRPNWKRARKLYELEGKSFSAIGDLLGVRRETVSRHAKNEGWVSHADVARKTRGLREEELARKFIERDADAIADNLSEKHRAGRRLLRIAHRLIDDIEKPVAGELAEKTRTALEALGLGVDATAAMVRRALGIVTPLELGRLARAVSDIEAFDSRLAGLSDDGWRSVGSAGDEDSGADSPAVQAALEELADDGSG